MMTWWHKSWRYDPRAAAIADRHYSRQSAGDRQFVPPGRCSILRHGDDAVWATVWQAHIDHAWPGTWNNCLFRHESDRLASELIIEAIAHDVAHFRTLPEVGIITMVDEDAIRRKRDPGRCYRRAGFEVVGRTAKRGRLVLLLPTERMPSPVEADGTQMALDFA